MNGIKIRGTGQASPPPPGGGRGPGGKGAKLPQDVVLQSERPHYI